MSSQKPCLPVQQDHLCSRKRKKDHDATTSDDMNGKVVVMTNNNDINFDDIEELDASTYLARVVQESKQLPDILTTHSTTNRRTTLSSTKLPRIDNRSHSVQESNTSSTVLKNSALSAARYLVSNETSIRPPPTIHHLPASGKLWVEQTITNFARLRDYLNEVAATGVGTKTHQPNDNPRIPVPPMKDHNAWYAFCFGYEDSLAANSGGAIQRSSNNSCHQIPNQEDQSNHPSEIPAWKVNLPPNGHEPTVSLLLQMDQVMVRRVLGHFAHYIAQVPDALSLKGHISAWVYALLARLQRPIHRDDAVTLCSLLKRLTFLREQIIIGDDAVVIRSTIQSFHQNALATLNVLIAIVGIYFEQGGGYTGVMSVKSE